MKKHGKVFLPIFLVFALAFTIGACAAKESVPPEKVDAVLWERMETADDDELIPICISLQEIDVAALTERVKAEMGSETDGNEAEFQAEKNRVLKEEQTALNNAFIAAHVEKRNNEVTYASRYISALFIEARKADILYYAQLPEVTGIYYDDPNALTSP